MRKVKCLAAVIMILCLLPFAAFAGNIGTGLPGDVSDWIGNALRTEASAQLLVLEPFKEPTLQQINGLLGHIRAGVELAEEKTGLTLGVDTQALASFTEEITGSGALLRTNLLPRRTLRAEGSALESLTKVPQSGRESVFADVLTGILEAEESEPALYDALACCGTDRSTNSLLKNVGVARWMRTARLTKDQSAALKPDILAVMCAGADDETREWFQGFAFSKSLIVTVYQTAEGGRDTGVSVKGRALDATGTPVQIDFMWAFGQVDDCRVDSWRMSVNQTRAPKNGCDVKALIRRGQESEKYLLDASITCRKSRNRTETAAREEWSLSGESGNGIRTLRGSVTRTVESEIPETTTVSADVILEDGTAKGEVEINITDANVPVIGAKLLLSPPAMEAVKSDGPTSVVFSPEAPIGYIPRESPAEEVTLEMETLMSSDVEALTDEMSQNLAGQFLIALAALPSEDTVLLRDLISEESYNAFLQTVQTLLAR